MDVTIRPRKKDIDPLRVALVQPPAWGALPPLGPAALKAYLEQHGHEARCFDLNISFYLEHQSVTAGLGGGAYGGPDPWGADSYGQWALDYDKVSVDPTDIAFQPGSVYNDRPLPIQAWAEEVLAYDPHIVGFSTYITSFAPSLLLAREIRRVAPSVLLVFGGPNVAKDREGDIALRTGIPDVVVHGEGEETLLDLVHAVGAGRNLAEVAGIGRLVGGSPSWTAARPLVPKIDVLPYPSFADYSWSDYPNPKLIPIMASRGCVLDCGFCYETVYWKRYRLQSPERVVAEMEHQIELHPMKDELAAGDERFYFMFGDSLVNGHLAGLQRMCTLLLERDVKVSWGGQATINKRMDEKVCRHLKDAGCTGLAFGLESGSPRVLKEMGKHFEIDDAAVLLRNMHEVGLSATVNVMVGFPTETFRDFVDTLRFLRKTRRWIYSVSNVTTTQVALGTDLHLFPEKYGVTMSPDGSWVSDETGDEKDRQRRLRILHRWMSMFRIPHQSIAPD